MSRAAQLVRNPSRASSDLGPNVQSIFPRGAPFPQPHRSLPPSSPSSFSAGEPVTPSTIARNFTYSSDDESPPAPTQPRDGHNGGGNLAHYRDRNISVESSDDEAPPPSAQPRHGGGVPRGPGVGPTASRFAPMPGGSHDRGAQLCALGDKEFTCTSPTARRSCCTWRLRNPRTPTLPRCTASACVSATVRGAAGARRTRSVGSRGAPRWETPTASTRRAHSPRRRGTTPPRSQTTRGRRTCHTGGAVCTRAPLRERPGRR